MKGLSILLTIMFVTFLSACSTGSNVTIPGVPASEVSYGPGAGTVVGAVGGGYGHHYED